MSAFTTSGRALSCGIAALALLPWLSAGGAAQAAEGRRGGLWGDYLVKTDLNGRQFESILSFSRSADGVRTGQWITFMGVSDLQDLKLEEGKLSFTLSRPGREGQTVTMKFAGTLADGKIAGTVTGDQGESKVDGARLEREFTSTMAIKPVEGNQLAVEWKSERLERTISDVALERAGKLTFKMKNKMGEREWDSTFEGTVDGDKLTGTVKSERGDAALEATRVGAPLIGTWNLEIASDRGARKQRLRVDPDMTGWLGSTRIQQIDLKDGKVSFKVALEFGEQRFEIGFEGTVKDSDLTGELTSSRGAQKVTGKKAPRPTRPQRTI